MSLHFRAVCPSQVADLAFCFLLTQLLSRGDLAHRFPASTNIGDVLFPFIARQNLGLQAFAEPVVHAASTAEEQKTIGVVLQPTAQQAACHHYSDLASSRHGLPSHTSGRKNGGLSLCA
jgi:hypothetical protein